MAKPTSLQVMSLPIRTHEGVLGESWFGGSFTHASIQELFSKRAMRSETSIATLGKPTSRIEDRWGGGGRTGEKVKVKNVLDRGEGCH